jgi:hypothetical protein
VERGYLRILTSDLSILLGVSGTIHGAHDRHAGQLEVQRDATLSCTRLHTFHGAA